MRSKTALVLAGGGLTGAVYEIGALRAIDDLLLDRTTNDFDIYVGTSSGALVSALLSTGITPEEMLKVINGTHPTANLIERKHFFNVNRSDLLRWLGRLPARLGRTLEKYISELDDMAIFDLFWSFSNLLPPGFYDGTGLEDFIRKGLEIAGYPDQFQALERELYVIATDLDSGERAVFGSGYLESSISEAVAASCAVPFLYQPVRLNQRDYIDGSIRGNTSVDLAIEHGAKLIVVINPMVPYNQAHFENRNEPRKIDRNISDGGMEAIANQLIRIVLHSNVHYHIKQIQRLYKDLDIILIEPRTDDYQMFSHNIMRYSARLAVAQHGFETVTFNLAKEYPVFKEILARHDIPITRSLVNEELNEITSSNYDPDVIRWILGARTTHNNRPPKDRLMTRLDLSLSKLDLVLDSLSSLD